MIFSMKKPIERNDKGFTLIVSILLLLLIAMVALGMISLSTIELRKSSSSQSITKARDNARMAMMIAIGELQQHLGPDQRISADARVTHGANTNAAHPHWLSAWTTTRDNGTAWVTRDAAKGGLQDRRVSTNWNASESRIACLVSGNENAIYHADDLPGDPSKMTTLLGKGSLGADASQEDIVMAPKVSVASNGNMGTYSWWVSDLGAKANVATRDRSLTRSSRHGEVLSQDQSLLAFAKKDATDDLRQRFSTESQIKLAESDLSSGHPHHLTVYSAAMPINVREGGWKRDLTSYLESSGNVPAIRVGGADLLGLVDSDNLVGPANTRADMMSASPRQALRYENVSPNFGLLRTWAQRAQENKAGSQTLEMEIAQLAPTSTGGGNSKSVDYRNRTESHLMPVLVEGSLYYNLSFYDPARPTASAPHQLRVHYYPRVALWNPYNVKLTIPDSAIFFHINGSKSVEITLRDRSRANYRMYWGLGGGAARGSMFFQMSGVTLEPGETRVWSPSTNSPYNETNFSANRLTTDSPPHPSRSLYQDTRADGLPLFQPLSNGTSVLAQPNSLTGSPLEWREIVPPKPAGNIQSSAWTQADDYFMSWKPLQGAFSNLQNFQNMPMGRFISCAYQYGDEDELPVEWTSLDPVPMARSTLARPVINATPDRRTRDGFRLRWLEETESNIIGGGSLAGRPHLEDSAIGNWNLRASWSYRNPFDNVTDVAPHFFGIYTRDLFDGDVDWNSMTPRSAGGRVLGAAFEQPSSAPEARILFDLPRSGAEIASLGAFQHVAFSEFIWHPTYALGNSLADPRIERDKTEPDRSIKLNQDMGGWNRHSIGWATDGRSNNDNGLASDEDNWAWHSRSFLNDEALNQNLIYDLSYELNHSLWDAYFLSSGTPAEKSQFVIDSEMNPLPNGRLRLNPAVAKPTAADLQHYHRAATSLLVDGALNINSSSIEAWESLLLSGMKSTGANETVAFPRMLDLPGGDWDGINPTSKNAWSGQRVFTREEIRRLAEEIVREIRTRGPFIGLSDFVNRRLKNDETGTKGTLQAAIDRSGLNSKFYDRWPLENSASLPNYQHKDNIEDPTRLEQSLKPDTTAWGALGFLTQADLLQFLAPALSGRSDTFKIRAYGEDLDASGKVVARAWCEAVVQRTPEFVNRDDNLIEGPSTLKVVNKFFGRRFQIISFRWLDPKEV
jgi:hypothetical protein